MRPLAWWHSGEERRSAAACLQVLDKGPVSGSPYTAVVGSDSWAIALTAEELQSFVQARGATVIAFQPFSRLALPLMCW